MFTVDKMLVALKIRKREVLPIRTVPNDYENRCPTHIFGLANAMMKTPEEILK